MYQITTIVTWNDLSLKRIGRKCIVTMPPPSQYNKQTLMSIDGNDKMKECVVSPKSGPCSFSVSSAD